MNNETQNSTLFFLPTTPPLIIPRDLIWTLDDVTRGTSLFVHLTYFLILICFKDLQKVSNFNIHHTNFIGLLFGLEYTTWINQVKPSFADKTLNDTLCKLSEAAYAILRYARSYSILIIAIYRVIAVYKINLYKKIAFSLKYSIFSALFTWAIATILFLINRYSNGAKPGRVICFDGSSATKLGAIIYNLVSILIGVCLPLFSVMIIYVVIKRKLDQISKRLDKKPKIKSQVTLPEINTTKQSKTNNTINTIDGSNSVSVSKFNEASNNGKETQVVMKSKEQNRERKLAMQFLVVNSVEMIYVISLSMLIITANMIPNVDTKFYWTRQLSRIICILSQTAIPIITLAFHPFSFKLSNTIFSPLFNRKK